MGVDAGADRYARQRALEGFGLDAQERLATAHAVVIGAGGLGSAVLPALAAAGLGTITVIDGDRVEASNLHRQTLYGAADVGRWKVEAAADALRRIAPDVELRERAVRFDARNAPELLAGADLLIDGGDTSATRYIADDAAAARGIPLVWGAALRWVGEVGVAWEAHGVGYRDLHPEDVEAVDESCEIAGVLPTVCGIVGSLMATEALKLLTGTGEPLVGRALLVDARAGTVRELRFRRDPAAPARSASPRPASAGHDATQTGSESLRPSELAALLATDPPILLDVREPDEVARVALPGATAIPLGALELRLDELDRRADLVVYCHHGVRSARALATLRAAGFTRSRHLAGGIDAYAVEVDPTLPRY